MTDKTTQPEASTSSVLKTEVSQVYKLMPGTMPKGYFPGFGELDLTKLNIDAANALVDRGFKWLVKK